MRRWLPFPLLWLSLVALWLLLNQTLWVGHILLGGAIAFGACLVFRRLEAPRAKAGRSAGSTRRALAAATLLRDVAIDIVRSNLAVARIVLDGGRPHRRAGFLDIPLALRDPAGLTVLACIITATPGTAWARYDARHGVLTIHVLDLADEAAWIEIIKGRYESPLLEIFQ
jgi:multicomponent K+:H+ antiporter subunit E